MPLIRYKTNDSCSLKKEICSCGRGFALMDDVATKNESIVSLPDGRLISPSVLTHPFKPMVNILESQIIQEEIGELKVKIVKNERYSSEDERMLISAFRQRLGDIRISIEYCDAIPRTKSGKFKWVVSKIKADL
jgi:phenylacetate-CoA ligase